MEVGYYIVGVMKNDINSRIRKKNTSESTDSKKKNKALSSEKGDRKLRSLGTVDSG